MHRLIMDCFDKRVIDHKNHIVFDNQKTNLRICTPAENSLNKKNIKGYGFELSTNRWKAWIQIKNKQITLGRFDREEDAKKARQEAEKKYFGVFRYAP